MIVRGDKLSVSLFHLCQRSLLIFTCELMCIGLGYVFYLHLTYFSDSFVRQKQEQSVSIIFSQVADDVVRFESDSPTKFKGVHSPCFDGHIPGGFLQFYRSLSFIL